LTLEIPDADVASSSNLDPSELRRLKILEYAARQRKQTKADKRKDSRRLTEYQKIWVENRMNGSKRSWDRWNADEVREEWEPWDRYGEPISIWRFHKLK
jgi:hypothetical protein